MGDDAAERDEDELTLEERVYGHLVRDLSLADVLSRGLANRGRTARELAQSNGWDEDVSEVLSALEDCADADRTLRWQQGRRLLERTHVNLETGLALLTVEKTLSVWERLEDAWVRFSNLPRASILDHDGRLELILNEGALEEVRQILPEGSVFREEHPVSIIRLVTPDDVGAQGVVAPVAAACDHHGIPVLHTAGGDASSWILLPTDHLEEAHEIAMVMTSRLGTWPDALRRLRRSVERGLGEGTRDDEPEP